MTNQSLCYWFCNCTRCKVLLELNMRWSLSASHKNKHFRSSDLCFNVSRNSNVHLDCFIRAFTLRYPWFTAYSLNQCYQKHSLEYMVNFFVQEASGCLYSVHCIVVSESETFIWILHLNSACKIRFILGFAVRVAFYSIFTRFFTL